MRPCAQAFRIKYRYRRAGHRKAFAQMIDLVALDTPPALEVPQQIDRKKRRGSRAGRWVIGAIIILGDGSECVFAGYDKQGNILCYPAR
jgi:hypothetical protein